MAEIKQFPSGKQPTGKMSEFEGKLKEQLQCTYRLGLYTGAYGISGAVHDMIAKHKAGTKKKLVDYIALVNEIDRLCAVVPKKPEPPKEGAN